MPYAELHCHSNFSFLDGASHPEELATEAARLGLEALAITDHNGFYGVVRFAEAAKAVGLPTVFGTEITVSTPVVIGAGIELGGSSRGGDGRSGRHGARAGLARSRSARHAPADDRRWPDGYARLSRALSVGHLAGEKGAPQFAFDDLADGPCWPRLGAHRLPQGRGAGSAGARRTGRGAP